MNVKISKLKGAAVHATVPANSPELGYLVLCKLEKLGWHTLTDAPISCHWCKEQKRHMAAKETR